MSDLINDDFDRKLVAKIKEEKIAPRPRWHFLLRNSVIWATGTASLLIGAGAVSVMIYLLKYNGWEIRTETNKAFWEFFLLTLPYFWILFLALFVFILYYNLKHTSRGYRYPVWFIVSSSILSSVILGSAFFLGGLGEKIDNILGEQAPFYDKVINRHLDFWFKPEEGRLVGIVTAKDESRVFTIVDPAGRVWQITARPQAGPVVWLRLKEPVDLIGRVVAEDQFEAVVIKAGRPGRSFFLRAHRPSNYLHQPPCPNGDCPLPPLRIID
ncbi:MAG: hypothetical protein WC456_01525 [Patescibacteria group bacterium]